MKCFFVMSYYSIVWVLKTRERKLSKHLLNCRGTNSFPTFQYLSPHQVANNAHIITHYNLMDELDNDSKKTRIGSTCAKDNSSFSCFMGWGNQFAIMPIQFLHLSTLDCYISFAFLYGEVQKILQNGLETFKRCNKKVRKTYLDSKFA